jgi:pantetheine-phosphate adenylyltransferase
MNIAIYPGSFDPFTLGHANLVERALTLFDRVVIAIGYNEQKHGWLPVTERVSALQQLYAGEPRIQVTSYQTLTADLARQLGPAVLIRGVRNEADFRYEHDMAEVNRRLSGVDTIFLPTRPELACISSSMVRELAHFGRDIAPFLPQGLRYR